MVASNDRTSVSQGGKGLGNPVPSSSGSSTGAVKGDEVAEKLVMKKLDRIPLEVLNLIKDVKDDNCIILVEAKGGSYVVDVDYVHVTFYEVNPEFVYGSSIFEKAKEIISFFKCYCGQYHFYHVYFVTEDKIEKKYTWQVLFG